MNPNSQQNYNIYIKTEEYEDKEKKTPSPIRGRGK